MQSLKILHSSFLVGSKCMILLPQEHNYLNISLKKHWKSLIQKLGCAIQLTILAHIFKLLPQKSPASVSHIRQKHITLIPKNKRFNKFRKHRALFSRLINTKPDVAFCANRAAQVSNQTFSENKINELRRGIKRM